MCWSQGVSVAFAATELLLSTCVFLRSRLSANHNVRRQVLLLPIMMSICAVEVAEALLWLDGDDLVPAEQSSHRTCSPRNKRLTLAIFLAVLPWQPFLLVMPTRRAGDARNRDLLLGAEILAVAYGVAFVGMYLGGLLIPRLGGLTRSLESSGYVGCFHTETCTFLGRHGRLHWTLGSPDTYVTPNIYTYTLLWIPVCLARPLRFSAGIILFMWGLSIFWLAYFELSFESGSVWCWSGLIMSIYFVLQPHLLPLHPSAPGGGGQSFSDTLDPCKKLS